MEALVPAILLALLAQPGDRPALLTAILADRFRRPPLVALAAALAHGIGSVAAALAGGALVLTPEAQSLLLAIALVAGGVTALWRTALPSRLERWHFGPFLTPLAGVFVLALGEQTQFFTFALAASGMCSARSRSPMLPPCWRRCSTGSMPTSASHCSSLQWAHCG